MIYQQFWWILNFIMSSKHKKSREQYNNKMLKAKLSWIESWAMSNYARSKPVEDIQ